MPLGKVHCKHTVNEGTKRFSGPLFFFHAKLQVHLVYPLIFMYNKIESCREENND